MLPNTDNLRPIAHWPIRLTMAGIFIFHGVGKVMMPAMAAMMGMSETVWMLLGAIEAAAGLGFIIGGVKRDDLGIMVTRLSGLAIIPVMLGAIYMVHWPRWSFAPSETHPMGGMEFQVLILSVAIYAFLTGLDNKS
jgi:putative oxidoreductase